MPAATSEWQFLLGLALPAVDHVFPVDRPDGTPNWTLGGGTAIAYQIGHRISHDIDIFVQGSGNLKLFTPRLNPAAGRISARCQWPGHYLKFERPEGEIDFLSAGLLTDPGYDWVTICGRRVALETPEEVIIKKIRYRGERFTARDVFDLAAVAEARPGLQAVLAAEVEDVLPRLSDSLRLWEARGLKAMEASVMPTGMGVALLPGALLRARLVVDEAAGLLAGSRPDQLGREQSGPRRA